MRMNKIVRYISLVFALPVLFAMTPVQALEIKDQQREEGRLRVELDVVPMPPQQDFEQYVQELAASAQREAQEAISKRDADAAKEKRFKTLNPIVLFRW